MRKLITFSLMLSLLLGSSYADDFVAEGEEDVTFSANNLTLDADDTGGDIELTFGGTLAETLQWEESNTQFNLSNDLYIKNHASIGITAGNPSTNVILRFGDNSFGGNLDRNVYNTYSSQTLPTTVLTGNRTSFGHYTNINNNKGGSSTSGNRSYAIGEYSLVRNTAGSYAYQNIGATLEARNESTAGAQNIKGVLGVGRQYDASGDSNVVTVYGVDAQALGRSGTEGGTTTVTSARGVNALSYAYHTDITTSDGIYAMSRTNNNHDGVITNAYGVRGYVNSDSDDGGSITNGTGGHFHSYARNTAPVMTNSKGIYAEANDGVNSYAIQAVSDDTRATTNYGLHLNAKNASGDNYGIYGIDGDWVLDADGDGISGGTGSGGDIVLGEGQDLEFYHDGTNSYVNNNTGDLYISDSGTDDVILSNNGGNVGIGTTDPSEKLQVQGNQKLVGDLLIRNDADTTSVVTIYNNNDSSVGPDIKFSEVGILASDHSTYLTIDADNDTTNSSFTLLKDGDNTTDGNEIFKVQESGKVTITGPMESKGDNYTNTWLQFDEHVHGNSLILGAGGLTALGAGESANGVKANKNANEETLYLSSDGDVRFITNVQAGWASRKDILSLNKNGNIGIGIDIPNNKLDLEFSGQVFELGDATATDIKLNFDDGTDREFGWDDSETSFSTFNNQLAFRTRQGATPPVACSSTVSGMQWMDTDTGMLYICDTSNGRNKWLSTDDKLIFGEETSACTAGSTPNSNANCNVDWGNSLGPDGGTRVGFYLAHDITLTGYGFSTDNDSCTSGSFDLEVWGTGSNTDDENFTLDQEVDTGLNNQAHNSTSLNIDVSGDQYILWGIDNNCGQSIDDWNLLLYYRYRHN